MLWVGYGRVWTRDLLCLGKFTLIQKRKNKIFFNNQTKSNNVGQYSITLLNVFNIRQQYIALVIIVPIHFKNIE